MTFNEKLTLAIEALRIIAISYKQRIDRTGTPAYDFARQTLERLDEDVDTIPDQALIEAICASCAELTRINEQNKQVLADGLTFVCEYCHVINHVEIKVGTIAIPKVFREAL